MEYHTGYPWLTHLDTLDISNSKPKMFQDADENTVRVTWYIVVSSFIDS